MQYESGVEGHCKLGYMDNCDMRNLNGWCLFRSCNIKNDPRIRIMEDLAWTFFVICNTQEEANAYASCYGNEYFIVSKEDIEALLASKILAGDVGGEYGIFIMMEANNDQ